MERNIIEQMLENARKMLVILSESEARYRADGEAEVAKVLADHGIADRIRDIRDKAESQARAMRRDADTLEEQILFMESMLVQPVPHSDFLYGIDLSKLDAATASLVRNGHLPTITQLGGHIENAAQSEDYAVALA